MQDRHDSLHQASLAPKVHVLQSIASETVEGARYGAGSEGLPKLGPVRVGTPQGFALGWSRFSPLWDEGCTPQTLEDVLLSGLDSCQDYRLGEIS